MQRHVGTIAHPPSTGYRHPHGHHAGPAACLHVARRFRASPVPHLPHSHPHLPQSRSSCAARTDAQLSRRGAWRRRQGQQRQQLAAAVVTECGGDDTQVGTGSGPVEGARRCCGALYTTWTRGRVAGGTCRRGPAVAPLHSWTSRLLLTRPRCTRPGVHQQGVCRRH